MVFPIVGGNQSTGDFITNSLRLNDDDSPSLSLDLSSPNTDKFTLSMWVKMTGARTQLGSLGKRLTGEAGDNRSIDIEQGSTGRLGISAYNGVADSNVAAYNSNNGAGPLLRDTSAWYNFVYAFDTGQGTAGDRLKWYINGVLQSGYNTTTTPSQNADLFDSSGSMIRIGKAINNESRFGDMYIAQYYYVDGQQYDHTYFGEFNDNGVWVPVEKGKGAGGAITFGTNGFYLEFKQTGTSANASGIGADTSGNGKHLTPANLAATDVTVDTPMNNFATGNPLILIAGGNITPSFSEGNVKWTAGSNGSYGSSGHGNMAVTNGKWYWEMKIDSGRSNGVTTGIAPVSVFENHYGTSTSTDYTFARDNLGSFGYQHTNSGSKKVTGTAAENADDYGSPGWSVDDIIGVAMDLDNDTLTFYLNGTSQGQAFSSLPDVYYTPAWYGYSSTVWEFNSGNPYNAISSGNSDGNGYGNFEYAVPSGFYSLCTKNLAEYG